MDQDQIIEALSEYTVMQLAELASALEEKWGVTAAAAVAVAAGPAAVGEAVAEEQTEFDVMLEGFGEKKINVIKVVRAVVTGLSLKEAKELVDSAPTVVKEAMSKDEAEDFKKQLEEAGATVSLK